MQPHRPFVPHPTPTKPRPAIGSADFAVTRPFIPGADRQPADSFRVDSFRSESFSAQISNEGVEETRIRPIELYLEASTEGDELPPVEHFIDPLPPVEDFAAEGVADAAVTMGADSPATDPAEGWEETDWQQYDWRSVAALGDTSETANEASNAWAATDWDAEMPRRKPTAEQDIASALDQIAQRIRDGELPFPLPGAVSDPAAIAATLAALLGIRR